jgi:hypothetical protein
MHLVDMTSPTQHTLFTGRSVYTARQPTQASNQQLLGGSFSTRKVIGALN